MPTHKSISPLQALCCWIGFIQVISLTIQQGTSCNICIIAVLGHKFSKCFYITRADQCERTTWIASPENISVIKQFFTSGTGDRAVTVIWIEHRGPFRICVIIVDSHAFTSTGDSAGDVPGDAGGKQHKGEKADCPYAQRFCGFHFIEKLGDHTFTSRLVISDQNRIFAIRECHSSVGFGIIITWISLKEVDR